MTMSATKLETPCIEWQGTRSPARPNEPSGYGRITKRKSGTSAKHAHRVAYEKAHGPIPEGLIVMHRCDNPPCVNPEHLVLGTMLDNFLDSVAKGRMRHVCGEAHPSAKLTRAKVRQIRKAAVAALQQRSGRQRRRRGDGVAAKLAKKYGVSLSSLYSVIAGKTWKET